MAHTKTEKISEMTTSRLSVYLRCLDELAHEGIDRVSSKAMAEQFGLNSAQIRKDLANFGEFGVRGVGYSVPDLRRQLREILGLATERRVAIIGAGNLGTALASYGGLNESAFRTVAVFDNDPEKVGTSIRNGLIVQHTRDIPEVIKDKGVEIAILAVPAWAAEKMFELAVNSGVKAILNFAPIRLGPRPGVKIKHVDFSISLESLSYFLARPSATPVHGQAGIGADFRDFLRDE